MKVLPRSFKSPGEFVQWAIEARAECPDGRLVTNSLDAQIAILSRLGAITDEQYSEYVRKS